MNNQLDNYNDFKTALEEVEALIEAAKEFENNNENKYSACKKSALLLLTAKFENFVETVAEDYINKINMLNITSDKIPDILLLNHTFQALEEVEKIKHKQEKVKNTFKELSLIWSETNKPVALKITCKFNYGSHGEKQLKKLFTTIGIDDIFSEVKVLQKQETLLANEEEEEIDIKESFNSVTGLRNNIIHQDASPSIGIESVEQYKEHLKLFAEELICYLERKINAFNFEGELIES